MEEKLQTAEQGGGKKLEDCTKEELLEIVRKQGDQLGALRDENLELKRFVNYVRNCKTHADYNRLRNIVTATNKKFKQ